MAFILPKGVFKNAANVEGSIESVATQPLDLDDIAKFWRVYTTTKRRLLDPTAERLENYWWRIWGSRRRELNGATIARLFAHISDGNSFVPLRGPANRDEGTPPLDRTIRHGPGATSATTIHSQSQTRPSPTSSSTTSKIPAPMPHPILKKTRGPSSTGPRPTARFISPHESDAETAATTNSSNQSSSPNSHVVVQPPSPDPQNPKSDKKTTIAGGAKKKGRIVASVSAKKRPVITRRQSSQSSTESAAKVEGQSVNQPSTGKTPPTFSQSSSGKGKAPSRLQENFSTEHLATPAPRERPPSKSGDPKPTSSRKPHPKNSGLNRSPEMAAQGPGPSSGSRSADTQRLPEAGTSEGLLELRRTVIEESNECVKNSSINSPHQVSDEREGSRGRQTSLATISDSVYDADMTGIGLKSAASIAPTLADATGQIDLGDSTPLVAQRTGSQGRNKGKGRGAQDMFAKRPLPLASKTAASPIPDGSISKSKSQLTLLLQKDRDRTGEQKPTDGGKEG
ncbi:hypothetical protein D0Z07_9255 [Hyphodiscus hymeniophilus]|uniref:Nitrogen regulatory protein areA GATA-like domain-containing protein n=1 Tax=Hyphodiscus hymeniophilus TaxID=353542 RepID=A0A9P6VDT6_9HELO|nr:hypothetical protein D0Z07_9255 [Hyphodiscus hymeniophilus]